LGLHTYDHLVNFESDLPTWDAEERVLLKDYAGLAQIPNCNIHGSRAPYLQPNDAYFTTLQNLGIQYDSSMTFSDKITKKPYWPFTLDHGVPDVRMCNFFGYCPTKAFPGLWEVPIIEFDYNDKGNCMDPIYDNFDQYLELLKANFLDTYNSNKVPRGFYWHWRYFSTDNNFGILNPENPINATRVKLFTDFYTWLVKTFPDIIFATERQVIEWMKNPVDFATTKTLPMFKSCPNLNINPGNSCVGGHTDCVFPGIAEVGVCGTECPNVYPEKIADWKFLKTGYKNFLGECKTFDGIPTGKGAYIGSNDTNLTTNGTTNGTTNRTTTNGTINGTTTNGTINGTTTNGTTNRTTTNGTTNGTINGTTTNGTNGNGPTNGTTNGTSNRTTTNGTTNGTINGTTTNGTNGAGSTNGTTNGTTNRTTTNGTTNGTTYETTNGTATNTTITNGTINGTTTNGTNKSNGTFTKPILIPINGNLKSTTGLNTNLNAALNSAENPLIQKKVITWKGSVMARVTERRLSKQFCATFDLKNLDPVKIAKSFIITFESCPKLAKITATWGYPSHETSSGYQMMATGISLAAGKTAHNVGGWCMDVYSHGNTQFKFRKYIRFGADLYEEAPVCTLPNCEIFCGNGVCDEGETSNNCKIDCKKLVCSAKKNF